MEFSILYQLQGLHSELLDRVMVFVTSLGNAGWIWIVLTLILLCIPKYRRCGAVMAAALVLDLCACNLVLKPLVARDRPCWIDPGVELLVKMPRDYSFPSGHSAAAFAAAVSMYLYHRRAGAAMMILAALVAFSRLYLFVHFPTDVLGGILTGVFCAFAARGIVEHVWKKREGCE